MNIELINLDNRKVNVKITNEDGSITRKAYSNTNLGRQEIQEELNTENVNKILAVWGDNAIEERDVLETKENSELTTEERLVSIENALSALMGV